MQTRRWLNPSLAQTLQIAVFLLYITGGFALLFGLDLGSLYFVARAHLWGLRDVLRIVIALGSVAAGYGIANERKWAYYLGIALAALPLVGDLLLCIDKHVSPLRLDLITLIFQIGMFALLIHPQSRDYQRVWFK
jgi:hypothetical protein